MLAERTGITTAYQKKAIPKNVRATMYTLNIPLLSAISSIAYLGGVFARLMISHRSLFNELSGYAIPVNHYTVTY